MSLQIFEGWVERGGVLTEQNLWKPRKHLKISYSSNFTGDFKIIWVGKKYSPYSPGTWSHGVRKKRTSDRQQWEIVESLRRKRAKMKVGGSLFWHKNIHTRTWRTARITTREEAGCSQATMCMCGEQLKWSGLVLPLTFELSARKGGVCIYMVTKTYISIFVFFYVLLHKVFKRLRIHARTTKIEATDQ